MAIGGFRLEDIDKFRRVMAQLTEVLRRRYVRKALYKGGEIVRKASQIVTPTLSAPIYRRGKMVRKPGTVRDAITVRRSKDIERDRNQVGVFVNVKPAPSAQRGADSPTDPYYWRFVHFATKKNRNPVPFLIIGARELEGRALREIETSLTADFNRISNEGLK